MRLILSFINAYRWTSGAIIICVALLGSLLIPIPQKDLSPLPVISLRVTDRNDVTLREVLSDQEGRAYWLRAEEIPRNLLNATIAAEDRYFYYHPGINPLAIGRALFQDLKAMRLVSGGSTIT
ncbi:MAG: transglycosylase domain-containing protein, partial [Bacteroidetes bacterium]|nr:transglycosylase domain-containing protein [Bacteroidota bacterium]